MFRLALGSEFQILAWGIWDGTSLYLPIQVSIRAVRKEVNEKYRDFFKGQFKLEPHSHWSPFDFAASIPVTFIWEFPPGKNLDCFRAYESTCNVNMFFFRNQNRKSMM